MFSFISAVPLISKLFNTSNYVESARALILSNFLANKQLSTNASSATAVDMYSDVTLVAITQT